MVATTSLILFVIGNEFFNQGLGNILLDFLSQNLDGSRCLLSWALAVSCVASRSIELALGNEDFRIALVGNAF